MAQARKTKTSTTTKSRSTARHRKTPVGRSRSSLPARNDAIRLLKADHRQVEDLFAQFEKARGDDRKQDLARKVCDALRIHARIEEEIFYPAFYEKTQEKELHHEAVLEHENAKKMIAEIESSSPGDDYFDARVTVLSEMIKHHVKEEEQPDGLFAKARANGMDLASLGEHLAERKKQLESSPEMLKALARGKDAGKGLMSRLTAAV